MSNKKIEIEIADVDILEVYARQDGHRDWGHSGTWLYPGDIIAQISGESAAKIKTAIETLAGV